MDLRDISIPLRKELDQLEDFIVSQLSSKVPFVENVVRYVMSNGGKRLRPLLTLLCARMSGYQGDGAIKIGAAIEFMHTASLLHDDVLDNATLRRGRESANKKWGNHVSVLVGDFFYCRAMDILVNQGSLKILRVITDAITTTTEGEIFEITKSNDLGTTHDEYLQIVNGKTAALIAAGCQAGGILGQISEEFEGALKNFGLYIGMAFQLMDDVLDYTSTVEEFGKVGGTDLKEGKLTLPLIHTLKKATPEEVSHIQTALISDKLEANNFKNVMNIIEKYDGINTAKSLALNYIEKAKEKLAPFKPSLEKETLFTIADYVITRRT